MIQLGYSQQDITPGQPIDLCGYTLRRGAFKTVHDPLLIRWIALRDTNGSKVLLGSADLIGFSRQAYQEFHRQICFDSAARGFKVALATTHTHSAPVTVRLRHCGKLNRPYLADAKSKIVAAAIEAAAAPREPVRVELGLSTCDIGKNRRSGNAGPVDNEVVTVAFVDDTSRKPTALLVSYACHPVVLGHESNAVSADYPGYLTKYIEDELGAPCLFLNGACGDINPINEHSTDPCEAAKSGEAIAKAALRGLKNRSAIAEDSLSWNRVQVQLPVRVPQSAADFHKRLAMLEERFGIPGTLFSDRVAQDSRRLAEGTYPRHIALELSFLAIGDELGILFVPGELFTTIGQRMKAMAAPRKLLISGFSNGSVGYLSDRQAYVDGGYEPMFANFFYDFPEFDPSIEDVLLDGFQRLIAKAGTSVTTM